MNIKTSRVRRRDDLPPSYYYECKYPELKELSTFPNTHKRLTYQQKKILRLTAARGSISSSDLTKGFPYSKKPIEYGDAKSKLRELRDLSLLERDYQRIDHSVKYNGRSKMRRFYKLSKYGVYNLISNNRTLQSDIAKELLQNYSDHLLFGFFLFPYIRKDTLSKVTDGSIFLHIFSYLHDSCKRLEDANFSVTHTWNQENGYLIDQLFIWENVPSVNYDTVSLRNFVKQKFKWKWLDKARIKKTEDLNGIEISYELNSILITLDKPRKMAILRFREKIIYEFIIRELGDELVAYVPTPIRIEDYQVLLLLINNQIRIPNFIFSLISEYNPNYVYPTTKILGEDERFAQALKKIKDQFDRRYKLIIEGKESKIKAHGIELLFFLSS